MIVRLVFVWSLLVLAFCSPAATVKLDLLTVGLMTYSNVLVLGANTTDLYFRHENGIANVKLKYLSPELQKRFGYDAKAAAEEEKKQSELDALYQKSIETSIAEKAASAKAVDTKRKVSSATSLADPVSTRSWLGKPAPPLTVEKWLGDKPVLEGKFVLLSFWAPWSYPCRKCIPDLNALQKKFADKLVVAGVCSESQEEIEEMPGPKPEFAVATDPKGKFLSTIGVSSVPCALLLDSNGIVQYLGHPGAVTEKKLQALLEKPAE